MLVGILPISAAIAQTVSNGNKTGIPTTIMIPKIDVYATVERVGTNQSGGLGLPKDNDNVAWYKDGPKPGELGIALLWGHLNSVVGREVFWNLKYVRVGDAIYTRDAFGTLRVFRVSKVAVYPNNKVPQKEIVSDTGQSRIVLFTCTGTWSRKAHNYSHRLLVTAVLVKEIPAVRQY